ncbi:MAG: hypothetical protein AAGK37_11020 [Pseudomonadota bacterium]
MKSKTSRLRFDEARQFSYVAERMGQPQLDSDANEQAKILTTSARRRTGDIAEGSPDDGFLCADSYLLEPVNGLRGWSVEGLPADDLRDIRTELTLARRDPESLPFVVRARGVTRLRRQFPEPFDLLARPLPLDPASVTFQAATVVVRLRFERPPTDDEIVDIQLRFEDANGDMREVSPIDPAVRGGDWRRISIPIAAFDAFPRTPRDGGGVGLFVRGWDIAGLPPRAEVFVDALEVTDDDLAETDFVIRGGDGTVPGAGRLFADGLRTFLESDMRYSVQRYLPNPPPLERPADLNVRHLVYVDLFEMPRHSFEDDFIEEIALDGEETGFRSRLTTQVRVEELAPGAPPLPPSAMGNGRLTTNAAEGVRPDRFPPEEPDPCRDRCLFSENVSLGLGFRGTQHAHVRLEVLHSGEGLDAPIFAWSRDNASVVAPLIETAPADAVSVVVAPEEAARFAANDLVVVEDDWTRLDPGGEGLPVVRLLRSVDTATGRLEFFPGAEFLVTDPANLNVGGPVGRAYPVERAAAVRRWDGVDWWLPQFRFNLRDNITFAVDGDDVRAGEYWTFTARVRDPDGRAEGIIETLTAEPVHGPERVRAPLALVEWTEASRILTDLRARYLPLREVRDRLIELGQRHISPGAFTVVVGDGVRTFGDIDQNLPEGVTGDEAVQTALARLGDAGGTIYMCAGAYTFESAVLLQARNGVRILGDGPASRIRVTGAGGAFHLDACGTRERVTLELMALEETPALNTPFGSAQPVDVILGPPTDAGPGGIDTAIGGLIAGALDARPLLPADLTFAAAGPNGPVAALGTRLRTLRPGFGRIGASIVRTLERLRRRQREQPNVPLELSAPEELAVIQGLPHGVVTVCDCQNIDIRRLEIRSRAAAGDTRAVGAGVLITGDVANITVEDNSIAAPDGVTALPYARYLSLSALISFPRASLFAKNITVAGNLITPFEDGRNGIRIADGTLTGLSLTGNSISGFPIGIDVDDRAEARQAGLDRIVVRDNKLSNIDAIGVSVDGDGVDLEANEIRLAPGADPDLSLRAAIRVTGTGTRVRDCWIVLPPSSDARDPLALEAGVVIGAGIGGGRSLARAVSDLEVVDTRISGAGAASLADGIVIAGPQPCHDIRLSRNVIRALGGSAIRAMAHGAPIGALTVADNRIEDVARAAVSWSAAAVAALGAREGRLAGLAMQTDPRTALARLLALDAPSAEAIDALLRWLDMALLRGGVVLSGVEEAAILRNAIRGVGTRAVPPNFRDPGGEIRTAGTLAVGGRDVNASDNRVEDVIGVVQPIQFNPPPVPGPVRPPVFDLLDRFRLEPLTPLGASRFLRGNSVHEPLSGLRANVARFALAPDQEIAAGRAGLRLGVDSVLPGLRAAGGEIAIVAERIGEASDLLGDAAGDAEMREAADLLRAAVSDAAALTAPDSASAEVWSLAGAFDRTTLASPEIVAEQAKLVLEAFEALPPLQKDAAPEVAANARAVLDNPGSPLARRRLAADTGKLALVVETGQSFASPAIAADATGNAGSTEALRELAAAVSDTLAVPEGARPSERLTAAIDPVARLIADLEPLAPDGARRIRDTMAALTEGRPSAIRRNRVAALRALVREETAAVIEVLAAREDDDAAAARADGTDAEGLARAVIRRAKDQRASLLAASAAVVDTRLAETQAIDQLDESFDLKLSELAALQLVSLSEDEDAPADAAKKAVGLIAEAIETGDRDRRDILRKEARVALDQITTNAPDIAPRGSEVAPLDADKVGALAQLSLEIGAYDTAERRKEGATLYLDTANRLIQALLVPADQAEAMRKLVTDAGETLSENAVPAAARDAAVAALASVSSQIAEAAYRVPAAPPESDALAFLTDLGRIASAPDNPEPQRIEAVKRAVEASSARLSPSTRLDLTRAADLPNILDAIRGGIGSITRIPPTLIPRPPIPNGVRAHPADGIYLGAVARQIDVTGNSIAAVRVGALLAGSDDHPLSPTGQQLAFASVTGNTVTRAPVAAFDLRPEGPAALRIAGNVVRACAGAPSPDATAFGQAVITVIGEGELELIDNRMVGNGNAASVALLHEMLVHWRRGDIAIGNNSIRHAGGARGGTGILVLTSDLDAQLVARLCREPSLEVEPLPRVTKPVTPTEPSFEWLPGLLDPQIFAVNMLQAGGAQVAARNASSRAAFSFGGLELADAETSIVNDSFGFGARPAPSVDPATEAADAWLADRPQLTVRPIVSFLNILPPLTIFIPPQQRRSVQVVGNDVVAEGPALQILATGGSLVSAGISGNAFESGTRTAAVYLRNLDSVVFGSNRCEALNEVNVAVLRCGRANVSATGNSLVGRQPAAPPPKPLPPKPGFVAPAFPVQPGLSLSLDLGGGSGLSLPLRADALLESFAAAESGVFTDAAGIAEAGFKLYAAENAISPALRVLSASEITGAIVGGRRDVNAGENAPDPGDSQTVLAKLLGDGTLKDDAKLFGVAKFLQFSDPQARNFVARQLDESGGDAAVALNRGLNVVTGSGEATPAALTAAAAPVSIVEKLVALSIGRKPSAAIDAGRFAAVPLKPPPRHEARDRSLVIIGGARVAAVGNATTAGVYIHRGTPKPDSVQLNV